MATSFLAQLSPADMTRAMQHPRTGAERPRGRSPHPRAAILPDVGSAAYDELQRRLFQVLPQQGGRQNLRRDTAHIGSPGGSLFPRLCPSSHRVPTRTIPIHGESRIWCSIGSADSSGQLGDGIAWRASGYDRRYVIAVSSNASPGPMAGKSGLPQASWGATVEVRNRGSFGLLHDLTNCLRIGDITEFKPDGSKLLYEIRVEFHREDRPATETHASPRSKPP